MLVPLILLSLSATSGDEPTASDDARWGHSRHGAAYDDGPRQRPWLMDGIGHTSLRITTEHPEVQGWFDQGLTLLHGFWWYEAERSFRWCAKLDPDCAMAYWGMARAASHGPKPDRAQDFLRQAVERKEGASALEQDLIELEQLGQELDEAREGEKDARDELRQRFHQALDRLVMDHPDEVEVKALYWLEEARGRDRTDERGRVGREAVLQELLRLDPDHVGALHYRVHNWDGEEGSYAIDSCTTLSAVAPLCGHLQHMPGHVLSSIGMWHEAAIAMDSATRVEKDYMHRRRIMPEDNWDYLHNLDYLCYIQEQLGMYDAALLGAQQLELGPRSAGPDGIYLTMFVEGAALRALAKAERWSEVLERLDEAAAARPAADKDADAPMIPPPLKMARLHAKLRALVELGRIEEAEELLAGLEKNLSPPGRPGAAAEAEGAERAERLEAWTRQVRLEIEGLIDLRQDRPLDGIRKLTEAADLQEEAWQDDPPRESHLVSTLLGEALLELGSPRLAAAAFDRSLETVRHDGAALAGLVQAHHALGQIEDAAEALAALEIAWKDADPGNRRLAAARATGVRPAATARQDRFAQRMDQRSYRDSSYGPLGPSLYHSARAPRLSARDAEGELLELESLRGEYAVVVFYLGEQCLHCVQQLEKLNQRAEALAALDARVLAVSKDDLDTLRAAQPDFEIRLLSDPTFENAIRFGSYDDFEEVELHSTFLIDREGRIHWATIGGEPFLDVEFLEQEIARIEGQRESAKAAATPSSVR